VVEIGKKEDLRAADFEDILGFEDEILRFKGDCRILKGGFSQLR
jgi:hypothetical protein